MHKYRDVGSMILKNVMSFLLFIMLFAFNHSLVIAEPYSIHLQNIQKLDKYFEMDKDSLPFEEVNTFVQIILKNRQNYNNNAIAKSFILLANVAANKGYIVKVFKFAKEGLMLAAIDPSLELNLLLKVADGYYIQGQYHQVLEISNKALFLSEQTLNIHYQLIALSYRAVAHALVAKYQKSINDLLQVERLINENPQFIVQVELLEVLAIAHYYLGDIQTAATLYQRIIKLRFELSKDHHIEKSYYNLARAYLELERLDDAYSAFWQAKKQAEKKSVPMRIAYTELGLGEVLYQQGHYDLAYIELNKAEKTFKNEKLTKPYISTLIALDKASLAINRVSFANEMLEKN